MPKRSDLKKILIIGSGPIVIGQACEFDYSGTQACDALKEEGFEVILVNSNPATIMTDPIKADKTYIEPLTVEVLEKIIKKERPQAVLPTLGGQTGLNLAKALSQAGVFKKYDVEMLGATEEVIDKAENRLLFKEAMEKINLRLPKSIIVSNLDEAKNCIQDIGFPCVVRPSFTLGGTGGGIAHTHEELTEIATGGLDKSLISSILIEESIYGWQEFELEVMRDKHDNVVIVCAIENLDPMGIHTGDSITVAPAQTLTDKDYQKMRNAAIAIMREIGVETGGANVQFGVNPKNGDLVVIEVNPRVSRSSALASKATGFPIAKFAAKLAVGYTLDELQNDITKKTPACFEPSIDYCVVKIPRFNFKKFPGTVPELGTSMRAVGEIMAIGRTFKEAMQKGIRSLEVKRFGLGYDKKALTKVDENELIASIKAGSPWRLYYVQYAFRTGKSVEWVHNLSKIDPWFLIQLKQIVDFAENLEDTPEHIKRAKELGFSDHQLAFILKYKSEPAFRKRRKELNINPTYNLVDTCSAEFEAETPYYYSTYETETEIRPSKKKKIMILGGGPNRIGQGIEFDYCCVHSSYAIREEGYESIMVNSNPETVSTDFNVSDKLFFEPLTYEDVLNIYEVEKPEGVIVQFGGQTPLNLSKSLEQAGVTILGTSSDSIDRAEDRKRFQEMLHKLDLKQPENGLATSIEEAISIAETIGYPIVVRPSYVLGGAFMEIVYSQSELETYVNKAIDLAPEHPVLIDRYLDKATEVDVDALSDGNECIIAGIMEHIEQAGVHSGDSACSLPPYSLSDSIIKAITEATKKIALELQVKGLLNIQFAVKNDTLYIIEVNPRASRTIPFVSKATGIPWANLATKIQLGRTLEEVRPNQKKQDYFAVKEAVLPFNRFPNVDILLSPEMKSTGESMGLATTFGMAFYKSQIAAGQFLPKDGNVFISVGDQDKPEIVSIAKTLTDLGFKLISTEGTANHLAKNNIKTTIINKISDGQNNVLDYILENKIQLAFNTPSSKVSLLDEIKIRQQLLTQVVPYVTNITAMEATVEALKARVKAEMDVQSLQEYIQQ